MERLTLVKIGGSLLETPDRFERFLDSFQSLGGRKLLVHGGGAQANRMARTLGLESTMLNGRRITDAEMLEVVTMVYAGLNSKKIVALLQSRGCNAVGLSGADGNAIRGAKRGVGEIDFGFVGDIAPEDVNLGLLELLLENDCVPVLNPITHDGRGNLLNTNADTIAATVAIALSRLYSVHLLLVHDKPGVLEDLNDPRSVVCLLKGDEIARMKERGTIAEGMLPKIDNALAALRAGVERVRIGGEGMLENDEPGTRIILD